MPWRSKTLTKYVVGGSDDASVDSDNGWQRVGVDLDVGSLGNPVGAAASDGVSGGLTPQMGIATVIWMSQVLCILQEGTLTKLRAQWT